MGRLYTLIGFCVGVGDPLPSPLCVQSSLAKILITKSKKGKSMVCRLFQNYDCFDGSIF